MTDPALGPSEVLAHVAAHLPRVGRPLLVAVDGPDGSGKTVFADGLAELLAPERPVARASIDDFHHPRAFRHALGRTPDTVWSRSFDYRALRRELIDPWLAGAGATYRPRWHDLVSDTHPEVPLADVPDGGVLVVDGVFAQRCELAEVWDLVVYLDAPPTQTVRRLAARDGSPMDLAHPDQQRYLEAQRRYRESCDPLRLADVVVDNADFDAPRLVAADGVPPGWHQLGDRWVKTVSVPLDRPELAWTFETLWEER